MDDLEDLDVEDDTDEFISTDNLDYYVPMTDEEREQYEQSSLRAMEDAY